MNSKSPVVPAEYVLVGLTGSIGSGKSTVADMFEQAGIPVLRADEIARELMTSNLEMQQDLIRAFGAEAYQDGALNREFLAGEIFSDPEKLQRMNAIVHPRTIAEQGVRARTLVEQGNRVVACEAALIFETGGEQRFDYVVVVDADQQQRMLRAATRDGATLEDVQRRDAAQMPASQKVERADFVIRNDGTLEQLQKTTSFVISLLKSLPPRHRIERDEEDEGIS